MGIRGRGQIEALSQSLFGGIEENHVEVSRAGVSVEIRRGHLPSRSVVSLLGMNQLITGSSHLFVMERFVRL